MVTENSDGYEDTPVSGEFGKAVLFVFPSLSLTSSHIALGTSPELTHTP